MLAGHSRHLDQNLSKDEAFGRIHKRLTVEVYPDFDGRVISKPMHSSSIRIWNVLDLTVQFQIFGPCSNSGSGWETPFYRRGWRGKSRSQSFVALVMGRRT